MCTGFLLVSLVYFSAALLRRRWREKKSHGFSHLRWHGLVLESWVVARRGWFVYHTKFSSLFWAHVRIATWIWQYLDKLVSDWMICLGTCMFGEALEGNHNSYSKAALFMPFRAGLGDIMPHHWMQVRPKLNNTNPNRQEAGEGFRPAHAGLTARIPRMPSSTTWANMKIAHQSNLSSPIRDYRLTTRRNFVLAEVLHHLIYLINPLEAWDKLIELMPSTD